MRGKFKALTVYLTREERDRARAEAYSREVSTGEIVRRALVHYFACQDTRIAEICKPPRKWRMPRPSIA